jgi:hypothetical protein
VLRGLGHARLDLGLEVSGDILLFEAKAAMMPALQKRGSGLRSAIASAVFSAHRGAARVQTF